MTAQVSLGIVVIGRNEGERLRRCLLSLSHEARSALVVYVDSASTDGSPEVAQQLGAEVVDLDVSQKFTAARARNAGFRRLIELAPGAAFVQFVDGDCEVEAGWISAARARLEERSELAVVCGRRRERFPEYSIYNKLCDLECDTPIGDAKACGGDAMMRVAPLLQVGGYRESLIAGEEPELCIRLRKMGYQIERLDASMTIHDAAMSEFSQWFKRAKRSGHATAERALLHGAEPERPGVKQTASNLAWGAGLPAVVAASSFALGPVWSGVGGLGAYGYLYRKSYMHERKRRAEGDAQLFAVACVLGKVPEALGAASCFLNRLRGKQSVLIEYKGPGKQASGS